MLAHASRFQEGVIDLTHVPGHINGISKYQQVPTLRRRIFLP